MNAKKAILTVLVLILVVLAVGCVSTEESVNPSPVCVNPDESQYMYMGMTESGCLYMDTMSGESLEFAR